MTEMIDDVQEEQMKYFALKEIMMAFPKMLEKESVWEILFKRDYPLFTRIKGNWKCEYEKVKSLQILSSYIGNLYVQLETLETIRDFVPIPHLREFISEIGPKPHNGDSFANKIYIPLFNVEGLISFRSEDFQDDNPGKEMPLRRYFFDKMMAEVYPYLTMMKEKLTEPHIYFRNGEITVQNAETYIWNYTSYQLSVVRDEGRHIMGRPNTISIIDDIIFSKDIKLLNAITIMSEAVVYDDKEYAREQQYVKDNKYKLGDAKKDTLLWTAYEMIDNILK